MKRRVFLVGAAVLPFILAHHRPNHRPKPTPSPSPSPTFSGLYFDSYSEV